MRVFLFSLLLVSSLACSLDFDPRSNLTDFLNCMAFLEGRILAGAFWPDMGMTMDSCFVSGADIRSCHTFSAASKESLHLGVLARALEGNAFAQMFLVAPSCVNVTVEECRKTAAANGFDVALDMMERKMGSLEQFNANFAGFGGFVPWFKVDASRVVPQDGWEHKVPALDNGEMIFGLMVPFSFLCFFADF